MAHGAGQQAVAPRLWPRSPALENVVPIRYRSAQVACVEISKTSQMSASQAIALGSIISPSGLVISALAYSFSLRDSEAVTFPQWMACFCRLLGGCLQRGPEQTVSFALFGLRRVPHPSRPLQRGGIREDMPEANSQAAPSALERTEGTVMDGGLLAGVEQGY